jgi:hypothetical protein
MPDVDLVVEIPVDAEPVVTEKTETTVDVAPVTVDEPIANLKKQLADITASQERERVAGDTARAEALAAKQEAAKRIEEVTKVRTELTESNVSVLENAIAAAQAEADNYQREQQAAFEAGDFAKASDSGRKMAKAEARIGRLEEGKADFEARKTIPPVDAPTTRQTTADPFEAAISNATPRAQKWLRDHPTYVTDQVLNAEANLAHNKAIKAGFVIDSDAYFDFCEQDLGLKAAAKSNGAANGGQQSERRTQSMPAAPVSRETTPTGGATSPTLVKLTPGEQRAATDGSVVWNTSDPKVGAVKGQPVGLKEYARRKSSMTKEGRYDRNYTEQ